jgi:glutamate-ammonia-ligase adenylyltransferase
MDNRFGKPQVQDEKGRATAAEFCIVSLGKLGSRELNYASDIDLLFLYSEDGHTSGTGTRGSVTNREYFVRLGEAVVQLVGKQTGEGAAYRVDMRLRPHGRVGALAISGNDAVRYYTTDARDWERQVLIRSRPSAGNPEIFKDFFKRVESTVFSKNVTVETALDAVRRSKHLIDSEQKSERGFNVKLGRGGIREIEFLARSRFDQ